VFSSCRGTERGDCRVQRLKRAKDRKPPCGYVSLNALLHAEDDGAQSIAGRGRSSLVRGQSMERRGQELRTGESLEGGYRLGNRVGSFQHGATDRRGLKHTCQRCIAAGSLTGPSVLIRVIFGVLLGAILIVRAAAIALATPLQTLAIRVCAEDQSGSGYAAAKQKRGEADENGQGVGTQARHWLPMVARLPRRCGEVE